MSESAGDESAPAEGAPVIVRSKNVSAVELAAVSAVVRGMLEEEGDSLRAENVRGQSAWQRSQRDLRGPVTPGYGRWNG
ncbi:acyl-CoA carboxylase subunit epsilon [Subtercola sp. PAMC28395]|uniref:acyl-CoA carboxylase subunit epsilon n=1 Tax=Subtercola sp. PAMC28395 TaxID=2846775 RepID=UPI001C0AD023|nr:acyl-CoA carboxylase subunit epsilon [Subtercola sp. PAMC28395]QWT25012.1 acyl-CoA carboxylase subunit epsilon [Subtercola sp. PAMC28395]